MITDVSIDPAGNVWAANNWNILEAARRARTPSRPTSTWGGGSGFTVIYGVAAPVKPPRMGVVQTDRRPRCCRRKGARASQPVVETRRGAGRRAPPRRRGAQRRIRPTISLVLSMVSVAIARARSAPSIRIPSTWPGSATSRFISAAIGASLATAELDQRVLEAGELPAAELAQHLGLGAARKRGIDADQIVGLGAGLEAGLLARQRFRIGLRLADLLRDGVGVVGEVDPRIVGGSDFDIFLVPSRRLITRVAGPVIKRLRQRKEQPVVKAVGANRIAEIVVELLRDVAGQFEMLLLVLADRHMGGAIDAGCRPPSAPG